MGDVRCTNKLHGKIVDGLFEIKCDSRYCGAGNGAVVLHRFSLVTGKLQYTQIYKSPTKEG